MSADNERLWIVTKARKGRVVDLLVFRARKAARDFRKEMAGRGAFTYGAPKRGKWGPA